MRIKIISDGTTLGTKVIDEETGEKIGLIQKIVWSADVNKVITECTVKLVKVPVEIITEAEAEANPLERAEANPLESCKKCSGPVQNYPNDPMTFYCIAGCNSGSEAQ